MDRDTALRLYEAMLLTRLTEERLVKLFRQGQTLGSVYRSLGQEATACATAMALGPDDVIAPLIRNLGSMLVRGVTPREVFLQYLGRATGPTGGREHNNHFGSVARGIIAPTSMLGALIPVMAGVALSFRQKGERRVAMTWIGDGGSSTGRLLRGAQLRRGAETPPHRRGRIQRLRLFHAAGAPDGRPDVPALPRGLHPDRGRQRRGRGVPRPRPRPGSGAWRARARSSSSAKPSAWSGHAEHDDQRYVDPALLAQWAAKDPLPRFEAWMGLRGWTLDPGLAARLEAELLASAEAALEAPWPDPEGMNKGIFSK